MDIQATSELIKWTVNIITLILVIIAGSLAAKKKQNIAILILFIVNAFALFVLFSPIVAWIASIICIFWVSSIKEAEQKKQSLKSSTTSVKNKKMVKPGSIIGLIIGICFVFFPILGFINKEATLSDSTGQMIGIGFIIFGVFMIIGNVISMIKGEPASTPPIKSSSEERLKTEKQIRCRFCKKLYSSEYNGCPHCKKK